MTTRFFCVALTASVLALPRPAGALTPTDFIPQPQVLENRLGIFHLDPQRVGFLMTAPSKAGAQRLADRLAETLTTLGLQNDSQQIKTGEGKTFSLIIAETPSAIPTGFKPLPKRAKEQGYELVVQKNSISIHADREVGLFYGLMTLEQLVTIVQAQNTLDIPCVRIFDWPALSMRGYSEDYGRNQLPTVDDHKRTIRNLARFKMNTYLFYIEPDHFVYKFDPELGKEYDRFTFDEIREIVDYAKQYYMDVIPTVELLGHMEQTLRMPKYRSLAEIPGTGDLCPISEQSFELVKKMVAEIAPAFSSPYFHCGLDESWNVGRGRSKQAVEQYGMEKVISDYYTRLNDLIRSYGKQMMMYADIALKYPDCLNNLPKNICMMYWDYTPKEHYSRLDILQKGGFPIVTLSALWDWRQLYPIYPKAFKNIETLARQSVEIGALGHFVSSWGDEYRGAAGSNLSELNNYGVAYCCSFSWNSKSMVIPEFSKRFALHFFGAHSPGLAQVLTLLAECQGENPHHVRDVLHDDPIHTIARMREADEKELTYWKKLKADTSKASSLLRKERPPRNGEYISAFYVSARSLEMSADLALLCRDVGKALGTPDFNAQKYAASFDRFSRRERALWRVYHRAYLKTNRPKNLKYIDAQWDWMCKQLATTASNMRANNFPPQYKKKTVVSFPFDAKNGDAWRDGVSQLVLVPDKEHRPTPAIQSGGPSGEGGYLKMPDASHCRAEDPKRLLDFGSAPFLIELWLRHTGQPTQPFSRSILRYGLRRQGWRLGIDDRNHITFDLSGIHKITSEKSIIPADGKWHHLAVNFSNWKNVEFYVDGKYTERLTLIGIPRSPTESVLWVGDDFALSGPFVGDLDRIQIRTGVFTAKELDSELIPH